MYVIFHGDYKCQEILPSVVKLLESKQGGFFPTSIIDQIIVEDCRSLVFTLYEYVVVVKLFIATIYIFYAEFKKPLSTLPTPQKNKSMKPAKCEPLESEGEGLCGYSRIK